MYHTTINDSLLKVGEKELFIFLDRAYCMNHKTHHGVVIKTNAEVYAKDND